MSDPTTAPPTDGSDARADPRSDIEQAVEARADAVARGEGGHPIGDVDASNGAGGVVKNQDDMAQ